MSLNKTRFSDDGIKIACAPGYMTEGSASNWAENFVQGHQDGNGELDLGTWRDFVAELDATFKDPNLQRKAMDSLMRGKTDIDKNGPESFFADYEILARNAGIPTGLPNHDPVHVSNLDRLMPWGLRDRILLLDPLPSTYVAYKAAVLRLYAAYRETRDRQTARAKASAGTTSSTASSSSASKPSSGRQSTTPTTRLSNEERNKRRAEGRCYFCGEKGHLASTCPKKTDQKPRVRLADVQVGDLTAQERAELRTRLDQLDATQTGFQTPQQ